MNYELAQTVFTLILYILFGYVIGRMHKYGKDKKFAKEQQEVSK